MSSVSLMPAQGEVYVQIDNGTPIPVPSERVRITIESIAATGTLSDRHNKVIVPPEIRQETIRQLLSYMDSLVGVVQVDKDGDPIDFMS